MNTKHRPLRETDDLYADLLSAHADLSPKQSARLNARLVLLLMSEHVEGEVFRSALAAARQAELPEGRSVQDG